MNETPTPVSPYREPDAHTQLRELQGKLWAAELELSELRPKVSLLNAWHRFNRHKVWDRLGRGFSSVGTIFAVCALVSFIPLVCCTHIDEVVAQATVRAAEEFHSPRVRVRCFGGGSLAFDTQLNCEMRGPGPRTVVLMCSATGCWRDW